MERRHCRGGAALLAVGFLTLLFAAPVSALTSDTEVTVGSPSSPFPQNKQNEPALAVDPSNPSVLFAGANENVDLEACNAGSPTDCPFTEGVGGAGVYVSFDGGDSWSQPTYTGISGRGCLGDPDPAVTDDVCVPEPTGPIGTVPWYSENGLVDCCDPIAVFGPRPDQNGNFSWANGSRLYYANITFKLSRPSDSDGGFKGYTAVGVSRTDDLAAAAAGEKQAWMPPVIATEQHAAAFQDREEMWADNTESSPHFGNVYICDFEFQGRGGAEPIVVSHSSDGGDTWQQRQISQAANAVSAGSAGGRDGCIIRTDSSGVVYVFWTGTFMFNGVHWMARSFDGGATFERPRAVATVNRIGQRDPVQGRRTMDGVAGARSGGSIPAVSIANGAPSGEGATDRIVMAWPDARSGLDNEKVLIQASTDGGDTWTAPVVASEAGDRPDFASIAISPDGDDVYLVYNTYLDPWQETTTNPRRMQGVVRHGTANLAAWTTLHRGAVGDSRGSSDNAIGVEFLGDYNYAIATNDFGGAAWVDVRDAAPCDAVNDYRQSLVDGSPVGRPSPQQDCPPAFGNSDIFAGTFPDPTP